MGVKGILNDFAYSDIQLAALGGCKCGCILESQFVRVKKEVVCVRACVCARVCVIHFVLDS